MSSSNEEKCPSCQGPLGPWSVTYDQAGQPQTACSETCATALNEGVKLSDARAEDYSTMAIGEDVLRKALMRQRG